MRTTIENGRIVLSREVLEAARLPENGECEVVANSPGLLVVPSVAAPWSPPYPAPRKIIEMLEHPVLSAIDGEPDPAEEVD